MDEVDRNYGYYLSSSSSETADSLNFPLAGILFVFITLMLVCIMCSQLVCQACTKFICCKRLTRGCCRFSRDDYDDSSSLRGIDQHEHIHRDRLLAIVLQQQMDEEACEHSRMAKRKERRMWYEYYMKPWTMIVEQSDLILHTKQQHPNDDSSTQEEIDEDGTITVQTGAHGKKTTSFDSDVEEIRNDCDDNDIEDGTVAHLKLPTSVGRRCVDGTCALCLDDYAVGEKVVWSSCTDCQHAFHKECFMQWLSKGKKRCPICRNWFVPGEKIDDQKIHHGSAWTKALTEMQRREKEEAEQKKKKEAAAAAAAAAAKEQQQQQQEEESSSSERKTLETTMSLKSVATYESSDHDSDHFRDNNSSSNSPSPSSA